METFIRFSKTMYNDKYLHRLIKESEAPNGQLHAAALSKFSSGNLANFGIEMSGQSCKISSKTFHSDAIEKANEQLRLRPRDPFRYIGFIEVDFCQRDTIVENIDGVIYTFKCFITPTDHDKSHCDLVLCGCFTKFLSFEDKMRLRKSKNLKIKKEDTVITCCENQSEATTPESGNEWS